MLAEPIKPARVRYIKLGGRGDWESECLERGIVRIGFGTARPDRLPLCLSGNWAALAASFLAEGKDKGTATRNANEVRLFFEDDGTTLWITFMRGQLYWGMVENAPPEVHGDGFEVLRHIRGGWCGTDLAGNLLSKDRLSGALTKLAAYRGTSCDVDVGPYVMRRINAQKTPEVERALTATQEMLAAILGLMRLLTPQDFEQLVDSVFTTSGWRRVGTVGRTQETVDLELFLPSTGERAFVQVKSKSKTAELDEYVAKFAERAGIYARMFFVFHSGELATPDDSRVTLIGPERLAELVHGAGLTSWLIEKVS